MHRIVLFAAITATAGLSAFPALADPTYTMTLEDAGTSTVITQSGTGSVTYSGVVGSFTVDSMSISDINPINPYDVGFASEDIYKAGGADTLNVIVTVSNLTAPYPSSLSIGTTSSANFEASSINGWAAATYFDPNNDTGVAGEVDLLSTSSGGVTSDSFSSTTYGATTLETSPFSYTVAFSLNLLTNEFADGAGSTTDVEVLVPEPASFAMFGAGLLGMVMIRRKRA